MGGFGARAGTLSTLALLLAAAPAHAKPEYCTKRSVQEIRVASGKPKLAGVSTVLCGDVTGDGVKDAIYTVLSGGTAGPTRYGVIRGGSKVSIVHEWQGYKTTIARVNDHRFDVQLPFYDNDDANCCPSAFDVYAYRWTGTKFRSGPATRHKHFQKQFS